MCQIACQTCQEPIIKDDQVIEVRQGFVEEGDFIPETEIGFYHADCFPARQEPSED